MSLFFLPSLCAGHIYWTLILGLGSGSTKRDKVKFMPVQLTV